MKHPLKVVHKSLVGVFMTLCLITFAQGPNSPEAAGFEPVDATDMVNLSNGNFTYVLPLLDVEGFPVSLSYHAGITADMDASWVGLGWYLNPGAINRATNGTPDDWKGGIGINFNNYQKTTTSYGITLDVSLSMVSAGVGMSWGGGQGLSGSVRASVGTGAFFGEMLNDKFNVGASAYADTNGNASVGVGASYSFGGMGGGASVSYSLSAQQLTLGVGAGAYTGPSGSQDFENSSLGIGASLTEGGGFSIGAGYNLSNQDGASSSAGAGMGSDSFTQGDASIDVQSTAIALPLHFTGIPLTIGFSKRKVKIDIRKGFNNREWGALYSSDFNGYASENPQIQDPNITYNEYFWDHVKRTSSMDAYSTRLPQSEEEFIGDYSKDIENINFTFMAYDTYNVAAQGLIGNISPRVFQSATIFGKGQRTTNEGGDPIHAFWHHGTSSHDIVKRELGTLNSNPTADNRNNMYFYFDGQFTSSELSNIAEMEINAANSANDLSDLIRHQGSQPYHNGTSASGYGRAKSPNYIEVFTNREIKSGVAGARGLLTPATVDDATRDNTSLFDPDGIGAYKITAPDGKTYHFALPVYHYEKVVRGQLDKQEDDDFDIRNVNEQRQYSRYATHWLLTAITGADYVDINNNGAFDKSDYGYWVELEYGKWSDGYVWRTPYKDYTYNYNTNVKGEVLEDDKGYYSFGRKQLYYLDKINTRNRTALFVKDIRYDALGKDLQFKFSNYGGYGDHLGSSAGHEDHLNRTNDEVFVKEGLVTYKREYVLKLDKIILVDGDIGKTLSKAQSYGGNIGGDYSGFPYNYTVNDNHQPGWQSTDFKNAYTANYSYSLHNEDQILAWNDLPANFIQDHALRVIDLTHDYELAKNSDSSSDAPSNTENSDKGKLTLRAVQVLGKGGDTLVPPTSFNYYKEYKQNLATPVPQRIHFAGNGYLVNQEDIQDHIEAKKQNVDSWGFMQGNYGTDIDAWSLASINTPTGARIEVEYEEDDYWTEAFSRRYWQSSQLQFRFTTENNNKYLLFRPNPNDLSANDINFEDYFMPGDPVFVDVVNDRDPDGSGYNGQRRYAFVSGEFVIDHVEDDLIKIRIPNTGANSGPRESSNCNQTPYSAYARYYELDEWTTPYQGPGSAGCNAWGGQPQSDNTLKKFKLVASRVPIDKTGGGLRVKELRTVDGNKIYKANYDYTNPFTGESSGITSYAPVDGLKFVPYQSEVPPPGVMYEYVTMHETGTYGAYESKTTYRHHVLKPIINIFNPNIYMEAIDPDDQDLEDHIFWANVTEDYGGLNGNNSRDVTAKKIDIHVNTAIIGQLRSIENYNSHGQLMMRSENDYINGRKLADDPYYKEENRGVVRESFNSLKSIYRSNESGSTVYEVDRLLSVSSKTEYNNMLKRVRSSAGGYTAAVEYDDIDPWLGSFRQSISTDSRGKEVMSTRVPAYEKYLEMGSKVDDPYNRNMLTQEAISASYKKVDGVWKPLNVGISTWNNNWYYVDSDGVPYTVSNPSHKIWRKHQTFVWDGELDDKGFLKDFNGDDDGFNWAVASAGSETLQSNPKWKNVGTISKYNHYSSPVEITDINGNKASTKYSDEESKVIATANTGSGGMIYSGGEYADDPQVYMASWMRNTSKVHTGRYGITIPSGTYYYFYATLPKENFKSGNYKVSLWAHKDSYQNLRIKEYGISNTSKQFNGELVFAGDWVLMNHYFYAYNSGYSDVDIIIHGLSNTSNSYIDDFRMHALEASMNSYVYNEWDELEAILGPNNLATKFEYDAQGRLKRTYTEVIDSPGIPGGFQKQSENDYHYKLENQ
jgi:hypothetical protein